MISVISFIRLFSLYWYEREYSTGVTGGQFNCLGWAFQFRNTDRLIRAAQPRREISVRRSPRPNKQMSCCLLVFRISLAAFPTNSSFLKPDTLPKTDSQHLIQLIHLHRAEAQRTGACGHNNL